MIYVKKMKNLWSVLLCGREREIYDWQHTSCSVSTAADKVVSNEMIGEEKCLGKYSFSLTLCLCPDHTKCIQLCLEQTGDAVIYEWEANSSER